MLQKPHGNLQIKRTCVAFHRRLGFLSPPDLNSTPWDTPEVARKNPWPISPRACRTEAVTEEQAHCPTTRFSGATSPLGGPTLTAPGMDSGPASLFGAPVARRVVRAPGRCQSVWKPTATLTERSAQQARPPGAGSQNFLCNLNQFSEPAGRPHGHREQAGQTVPDSGRPGLSPGRKSSLVASPLRPGPHRPRTASPAGFTRAHFRARPGARAGEDPPAPHLAGTAPPARPPRRPGTLWTGPCVPERGPDC